MSSKIKESDLEDKTLLCKDCGNKFAWTAGEQKFFLDKGLKNVPKRCKPCTALYKEKLHENHPTTWIKCVSCGKKTEVTFEPKSDQVLCEKCFIVEVEARDKAIKDLGESIPE